MINWKTRIKSKEFWLGAIGVVAATVVAVANLFGVDVTEQVGAYAEFACTLIGIVFVAVGVIADPTTKGLGDSLRAMTYTEPHDDTEEAKG